MTVKNSLATVWWANCNKIAKVITKNLTGFSDSMTGSMHMLKGFQIYFAWNPRFQGHEIHKLASAAYLVDIGSNLAKLAALCYSFDVQTL